MGKQGQAPPRGDRSPGTVPVFPQSLRFQRMRPCGFLYAFAKRKPKRTAKIIHRREQSPEGHIAIDIPSEGTGVEPDVKNSERAWIFGLTIC